MRNISTNKVTVCTPTNTCVTVYGKTAQTLNIIVLFAVSIIAFVYLYKALQ